MFINKSMTGTGLAVIIIMMFLNYVGIEADESTVLEVMESSVTLAGWIMTIYGQIRRKDLDFGFWRV